MMEFASAGLTAPNVICRDDLSLTRAGLGAPSDRFRWGEAKGRAEGSGQVRRIGEARAHGQDYERRRRHSPQ